MVIAGRRVWITGAASGIGLALAREAARQGARVLAIDRDAKALAALEKEAGLLGLGLATLAADVAAGPKFLAALRKAAARRGAPEVFVNNAGIARVATFAETNLADFERVLGVNLKGAVWGTHFALERMQKAREGLIVNIASMAGHLAAPFMTSYSASKFAVVGFTRSLQAELRLAQSPVRVCLVCPGFIDTPIMRQPGVDFPSRLRWMVARPESAAREILRQALAGRAEVYPDFGGRFLSGLHRWLPGLTARSSRLLVARTWAELLGAPIKGPRR